MKPYLRTNRGNIYHDDCLEFMRKLPGQFVNCGVTSPPYWGLRDYGEPGQLGLEKTPEEYVEKLVGVFREFKRVLRDDGTLWLNLGDSYAGYWGDKTAKKENRRSSADTNGWTNDFNMNARPSFHEAFDNSKVKPKDLVGIPWRVAFALQADGWYLRQDIIWHKPNPMPESVKDRCTKAHEYIFLLSKSQKYYYDHEAIKEPCSKDSHGSPNINPGKKNIALNHDSGNLGKWSTLDKLRGRNKRSVWTVTTKPFKEAHFATFPPDLILPCVLAGCPKDGVVMDMFFGAGTTGLVAIQNQRHFIGVELSRKYCEIAAKRIGANRRDAFEKFIKKYCEIAAKRIEAAASQLSFEDYL
jgi:DNA modification methylase